MTSRVRKLIVRFARFRQRSVFEVEAAYNRLSPRQQESFVADMVRIMRLAKGSKAAAELRGERERRVVLTDDGPLIVPPGAA